MTHICVAYLIIIASDNGLSPSRRQAIIWTNAGILLIRPLGTNFSEILIEIHTFSIKKTHLKMSSAKRRPLSWREIWMKFWPHSNFQYNFSDWWLWYRLWNSQQMSLDVTDEVNISSGIGLVPSGNKPLPEPMLTMFSISPHGVTWPKRVDD